MPGVTKIQYNSPGQTVGAFLCQGSANQPTPRTGRRLDGRGRGSGAHSQHVLHDSQLRLPEARPGVQHPVLEALALFAFEDALRFGQVAVVVVVADNDDAATDLVAVLVEQVDGEAPGHDGSGRPDVVVLLDVL